MNEKELEKSFDLIDAAYKEERIKLIELEEKFIELVQPFYDKKTDLEHKQRMEELEAFDISIVNETRKYGEGLYMPQFDYFVYGRIIEGIEFGDKRSFGGKMMYYLSHGDDNYFLGIDYSIIPPEWAHSKMPENIKSIVEEINKLPKEVKKSPHPEDYRHWYSPKGISLKNKHPYGEFDLEIKTIRDSHTLKFPTKELSQLFYEDFKVMWNQK